MDLHFGKGSSGGIFFEVKGEKILPKGDKIILTMKALRREDLSLHHYIKNNPLQDFIEKEENISLSYLSSESSPPTSYVYQAQSTMLPLPTSKGRGWVYLDNPSDITEQTSSGTLVVYDAIGTVISSSNYNVDYIDGRIIVATSSIVPATIDYKWHYVSLVDEWPDVESADVPVVAIGISNFTKQGFQLGGGKFTSRRVDLNIFASNQAEKDDISEVLYDGLYLKSCNYQTFLKSTMIDWDGTWNNNYVYATVSGSSTLKFDNVESRTVRASLMVPSRDSTMLSDLNRYRARISFDMIHWEESY